MIFLSGIRLGIRAAVIAITTAIAASGAESVDGSVSFLRNIIIVTLVFALADAAMYIFVEKLSKSRRRPTNDY